MDLAIKYKRIYVIDDTGHIYSSYDEFMKLYAPELYDVWREKINRNRRVGEEVEIIFSAPHLRFTKQEVCIIRNIATGVISMIGRRGLKRMSKRS